MHAVSHSLAHRGPGAPRARARWQPYAASVTSSTTPRSPSNYLNTPVSVSSSSSSPTIINPIRHTECPNKAPNLPLKSQTSQSGQFREFQKNQYVTGLVDQAVKSLCDIWHPDDIPHAFRTSSRTAFSAPMTGDLPVLQRDKSPLISATYFHNAQLPSPISPSTRPSPFSPPPFVNPATPTNQRCDQAPAESSRNSQLIPLKGFVHEVLRRSRTSTGVLQTALCYLEAVRGKVPDLLRKEKWKASSGSDQDAIEDSAGSRIVIGDIDDFSAELVNDSGDSTGAFSDPGRLFDREVLEMARTLDATLQAPLTAPQPHRIFPQTCSSEPANPPPANTKKPYPPLPPLPPLPSPLLCPRRTFLACLILASKFTQDRSYSNKAWAKLAGLPPREIGRCERALGEALEWRLWVGKTPSPPNASSSNMGSGLRTVARCRSESDLSFSSSPSYTAASYVLAGQPTAQFAAAPPASSNTRVPSGLRRSATAPSLGSSHTCVGQALSQEFCYPVASTSYVPTVQVEEPESMFAESLSCPSSVVSASSSSFASVGPQSCPYLSASQDDLSPSMSTPTLSYSPMSSGSSTSSDDEGDKTVQMVDLATPVPSTFPAYSLDQYNNAKTHITSVDSYGSSVAEPITSIPYAPGMMDPRTTSALGSSGDHHATYQVQLPPLSEVIPHNLLANTKASFLGGSGGGLPSLGGSHMYSYWSIGQ